MGFPVVSGTTWFLTLFILLMHWVAEGSPKLPAQGNPYVPMISDIGAFTLKPLFIVGGTITAVSFVGTVSAVHYARYADSLYGLTNDPQWKKFPSAFATFFGLAASVSLILLTLFDTFRAHERHRYLLLTCFGTLALSAVLTTVVWFDQTWKRSKFRRLHKWCILSNSIVLVDVVLGILFTVQLWTGHMKEAGVIEWIVTFLGSAYLFVFVDA